MKYLILMAGLCTFGCGDTIQDILYPADAKIDLGPRDMRLHCSDECPEHDKVREVANYVVAEPCFADVSANDLKRNMATYALTWGEFELFRPDGVQILGFTNHESPRQIYVWSEYEEPYDVLRWELTLTAVEYVHPQTDEAWKIDFIERVCYE